MENLHELYNKGINANYRGYKLGLTRGLCMGVIWGVICSIAFPFGNFANDFEGQIEHSMMIVSNIVLILACIFGSPFSADQANAAQEKYGTSRLYNHGYSNGYFKTLLISISVVLTTSSILSLYGVLKDKAGIWVAIASYAAAIIIAIYVYAKSPSKEF